MQVSVAQGDAFCLTWQLLRRAQARPRQVVVLSEGVQLYGADPRAAVAWFGDALHYPYDAAADGAPSDWLMDLVSVGFAKPSGFAPRRARGPACVVILCIVRCLLRCEQCLALCLQPNSVKGTQFQPASSQD